MKCGSCGMTIRVPAGEAPIKYIGKHNRKYHPEKFKHKPKPKAVPAQDAAARSPVMAYCPLCGKKI